MLGRSFVGLVVPRYTQEKASDLSVLILRSSFFQTQNARGTFHNRLKPSKLTWTAMYRKQHKKDIAQEAVKKRRRATKKPYSRSIVGATLEGWQKRKQNEAAIMADSQDIVDPLSYLEDLNEIADSAWYESLMSATNQSFQNGKNEAKKRGAEKQCNSQQSAMRRNRKFTKEKMPKRKLGRK
ncbi:hypothetical protein GOBAR_DD09896 [Gossypium barbadense]|nr:hypothetical protein GOBAR_DD09896 [Gossypium barbadense]